MEDTFTRADVSGRAEAVGVSKDDSLGERKSLGIPAEALGVSRWLIRGTVRAETCPIEPIRVGNRVVFSRARLDDLLGAKGAHPLDYQSTSDREMPGQKGCVNQKSTISHLQNEGPGLRVLMATVKPNQGDIGPLVASDVHPRVGSCSSRVTGTRRDRIPEVLARTDLRALVSEVAGPAVRVSGSTARYHCPNPHHPDAHPSFAVKGERWRCWSQCDAWGNAIDLVMFVGWAKTKAEAIELLARRVGIR